MNLKGIVKFDLKTKNLVKRLQPGDIALINHEDLDEVAACSLLEARIKAVVNVVSSISEKYPNPGPLKIVQAGIPLVDEVGPVMDELTEGQEIEIINGKIIVNKKVIAEGKILTEAYIKARMEETRGRMGEVLSDFVVNTLEYAQSEIGLITDEHPSPVTKTSFKGKHALIVVRGQNYKKDLMAIKSYIEDIKPVLIGVDGGSDALIEFGFKPDLIIGDMDSVSDSTLKCGAEIIVHAYPNGKAPGMERIKSLGLEATTYPAPGTSEDIAMLIAYDQGAELIVAVGTHSNMLDFLEKGRKGMASTFLVRMKVGSILVDARGVSQLYGNKIKPKHVAQLLLAGLMPVGVIMMVSPPMRETLRLIFMQVRLIFGI